jgi:predicted GH43/DUF377 family glycosyl hydrolase
MSDTALNLQPSAFKLRRLGTIMTPAPDDAREAMGVLNPAACRGRDGELYLFARVVAAGNYSRVGVARVLFTGDEPTGVERLGFALEPTEPYEQNPHTAGCEDARVVFIPALDRYVMTYTAYGSLGPRVAMAVSEDLMAWHRIGPAKFTFEERWRVDFDMFDNKDAFFFPEPVRDPQGRPALALMHRPDYRVASVNGQPWLNVPDGMRELRPGCWLSYVPLDAARADLRALARPEQHEPLAFSERPWEAVKMGGGTPPVLTPRGWLTIYHGVSGEIQEGVDHQTSVFYSAGAMLLDRDDPRVVRFRSAEPILAPGTTDEREGLVNNVVFPTGLDLRGNRLDVYYGMADSRIGVATTTIEA